MSIGQVGKGVLDMKKISILKARRTRLLNKKCDTLKKFEEIQNELNELELEIRLLTYSRGK